MVLLLFLCFLPLMYGAVSTFGVVEVLGAMALACFAVAGAAARPRGSAWLGALLGAGLYLLPGVLLVCLVGGFLTGDIDWYSLRLLLWWPSFPVAMANCSH